MEFIFTEPSELPTETGSNELYTLWIKDGDIWHIYYLTKEDIENLRKSISK